MAGALGCFGSLVIVGSLIAAFGSDWPAHPVAGHVAIGERFIALFILFYTLTGVLIHCIHGSIRIYLRCQLLLLLGAHWLGSPK